MSTVAAPELVVTFRRERPTKNKIRFEEDVPEGGKEYLRTLYLSKGQDERMGNPQQLRVTLTPA